MAIIDYDDAVNKCSGGNNGNPQPFFSYKYDSLDAAVAPGAISTNRFQSFWQFVGCPSHGSVPGGTAVIPDRTTNGALGQANATGGRTLYLSSWHAYLQLANGELVIADRLATISGLSGTSTAEQNITGVAVNRYTGAESVGNEIWIEIYTAVGASATTIKAKYTNQAGTAGQVTPLIVFGGAGANEAQAFIRLPLASGDSGVRSVESVTVTATTGTVGDFGVTIARSLASLTSNNVRMAQLRNYLGPDFAPIPIKADACLFFYMGNSAVTTTASAALFIEA